MAGGYSVTISAKDAASPTLDAFNKRFAAMQKRAEAVAGPFKELGDRLDRFSKVTGIDKIATGFKNFAVAADQAWRSVSRVVEPLTAIVGAVSIAGLVRQTQAWAAFGTTLGNQAARAGVAADQLYNLQNAARLASVGADTLTAGLTAMNDRMRDAQVGAAPNFLMTLRALGLSFDELNRMNPEQRLRAIADALNRVRNPTDRALYTRELFGDEGLMPFLREGSAGIARREAEARRLAGGFTEEDERRARQLSSAWVSLGESITSVGNAVASAVAPVLVPLLTEFAQWISDHRKDVSDFFLGIAHALEDWSKTSGPRDLLNGLREIASTVLAITKNILAMVQALGVSQSSMATAGIGAYLLSKIPGSAWLMRTVMSRFPWLAAASLGGDTNTANPLSGLRSEPLADYEDGRAGRTNERYGYTGDFLHDLWHFVISGGRPGPARRSLPGGPLGGYENGVLPPPRLIQGSAGVPRGLRNNNPLNLGYVFGQQDRVPAGGVATALLDSAELPVRLPVQAS